MTRRPAAAAAALLLLAPVAASAQSRPLPMPEPTQVDRIERQLGEVLRRLDALEAAGASPTRGAPDGTPSPAPSADYRPGALAVLRPAPSADALLAPPADSLSSTVHAGGPLRLYGAGTAGRPGEPAGVELQGWLRAREAGRYQVFADFAFARAGGIAGTPCAAVLWVEERRAGSATGELGVGLGRPGTLSLTLGADLAAPGLYRFRLWLACARSNSPAPPATAEVALKAPSDGAPRGLAPDDLLHRGG